MADISQRTIISCLCAILILIVILVGIDVAIHSSKNKKTSSDQFALSNTLFPFSFRAKLDLNTTDEEFEGTISVHLELEWDSSTSNISFREIRTYTSPLDNLDLELYATITIVRNKATTSITYDKKSHTFCVNNVTNLQWFRAFRNILVNEHTIKIVEGDLCSGTAWEMMVNGQSIELCVLRSQLVYVITQGKKASVVEWETNSLLDETIQLPLDILDGPCREFYNNITCSYEKFDQRKRKRDTSAKRKTCLFVHGAGESPPVSVSGYNTLASLPEYWGKVQEFTPDCASHKFIHYNSIKNGWDNDKLHENFCEFAATGGVIKNKVIFSHSMGNLLIAAALHRGKCKFDKSSSRWFSVQGPWKGSKVADTVVSACENPTIFQSALRPVLELLNYCAAGDRANPSYKTLITKYKSSLGITFDDLVATGMKYVSGVMCGTGAFGIGKSPLHSVALQTIAHYSNLENPNDGMVAFSSCNLHQNLVQKSSRKYYMESFNHAEGTCRYGDPGWLTGKICIFKDVHPCRWYLEMS